MKSYSLTILLTFILSYAAFPGLLQAAVEKEGRVLVVNEDRGFLVVNLGRVDRLKENATLVIQKEEETLATLKAVEVRDVMTVCEIVDLKPDYKIEPDDPVKLRPDR